MFAKGLHPIPEFEKVIALLLKQCGAILERALVRV
jgi:hypothetical protein